MYYPMGLQKTFWPARGYTKKILLRIYAQKASLGNTRAKTEDLKNFSFCNCSHKKGVTHEGGHTRGVYTWGITIFTKHFVKTKTSKFFMISVYSYFVEVMIFCRRLHLGLCSEHIEVSWIWTETSTVQLQIFSRSLSIERTCLLKIPDSKVQCKFLLTG